jgi:preprotein translocase subunit SecG
MTTVVIVIHLMVVLAMIGLILLQRSEGGALGIGGGQGGFMTGRSAGNVLSHTTAYLALAFFVTSLGLALIAKYESRPADILERLPGAAAPATAPTSEPEEPAGAPTNAQDVLKQLGGTSGGPQTPPAEGSGAPAANGAAPAAPAPTPSGATTPATPPASPQAAPPTPSAPAPQPAPAPTP